jgi:hypothetical protein
MAFGQLVGLFEPGHRPVAIYPILVAICALPQVRKLRITTETQRHGAERPSDELDILLCVSVPPW